MSGEINVLSRTQIIVVASPSKSVSIINAGPPGPASTKITASNTAPTSPSVNDIWIDTSR